ncbi:hypothetical protein B0H34DRAFT_800311 [Crassisporium funariophilum]|nr:hypothetical protein B0H34DRAFT_800311 [Crassisporium funariophilum]
MPGATRQPTPGPSLTTLVTSVPPPHIGNARKRAGSEVVEEARDSKKIKVDDEVLSAVNGKDKKKKKRKKRKRTSVVAHESERKERPALKSRTAPVSSQNPASIADKANGTANMITSDVELEHVLSSSDKGKGKAKSGSPVGTRTPPSHMGQSVASGSSPSAVTVSDSTAHASEVARLKEQLASQKILLDRHQTHLVQYQQSLTCQICLDLLHKPFALAPCGHITCYPCLVRWFTAPQNPTAATPDQGDDLDLIMNGASARRGAFIRKRKTCPVCRAVVIERPVEMWGVKGMVATLVRSKLVDLPVPIASPTPAVQGGEGGENNNDPWRNMFRRARDANDPRSAMDHFFYGMPVPLPHPHDPAPGQPHGDGDRERMGWYDAEDGGIYRCIDCYHEIWAGVCSSCNRGYPGHEREEDDDDSLGDLDEDSEDEEEGRRFRMAVRRQWMEALNRDHDDDFEHDEEGDEDFWDAHDLDMDDNSDAELDGDDAHHLLHHYLPDIPPNFDPYSGAVDGDDGMTESDVDQLFPMMARGFLGRRFQPALIIQDDEEEEDEDVVEGIARIDEVSDGEDDEESMYGGSFIDDGGGGSSDVEDVKEGVDVIELDGSGSSGDEAPPEPAPRVRLRRSQRPGVRDYFPHSDDDEPSVHAPRRRTRLGAPPPQNMRFQTRVIAESSDEGGEESDLDLAEDNSLEGGDGVDHDGDDDGDVAAVRYPSRNLQRRVRRRPAVDVDEDESE